MALNRRNSGHPFTVVLGPSLPGRERDWYATRCESNPSLAQLFWYTRLAKKMAALPQAAGSVPVFETKLPERAGPGDLPVIDFSTRIPALDGLRGIAILLVLLCHSIFFELHTSSKFLSPLLIVGQLTWSGVDLFFVLSGFLIGGILLDTKDSPRYFKTFYVRRAYRILPVYAVVLALFSLRFSTWQPGINPLGNFSHSPIPLASYATFTQNVWMALFGTLGAGTMAATWSLAVEEQFYLSVPFVIRKVGRSHLTRVLIFIILGAPLLRIAIHLFFEHSSLGCYVLTPCRADSLSLGVLCAVLVRTHSWWKFVLDHRSSLCWLTGALSIAVVALAFWGGPESTPMITIGYSVLALFYGGCLMIAITGANAALRRLLCNRGLMQLGSLAYCTYLVHLPLMEACRRFLGLRFAYSSPLVHFLGGVIGVALTLGIAKLSWTCFEKPLLRRGHAYKY